MKDDWNLIWTILLIWVLMLAGFVHLLVPDPSWRGSLWRAAIILLAGGIPVALYLWLG